MRIHNGSKKTCVTTQNVFLLCNYLPNLSYQVDNNALVLISDLIRFEKKYCLIHTNVLKVAPSLLQQLQCITLKSNENQEKLCKLQNKVP